jgi:hypothetical protein
MARGRKPEVSVTSRLKPNIESTSNTVRSKSIPNHFIEKNNTNRSISSSIQGISLSKKSVPQVEASTTNRSKPITNIEPNTHNRRFSSIKNLETNHSTTRSRPSIESISNTVVRSKPITKEILSSGSSSVSGVSSIHNPKNIVGIGSIPRSTRNGPLRISDL